MNDSLFFQSSLGTTSVFNEPLEGFVKLLQQRFQVSCFGHFLVSKEQDFVKLTSFASPSFFSNTVPYDVIESISDAFSDDHSKELLHHYKNSEGAWLGVCWSETEASIWNVPGLTGEEAELMRLLTKQQQTWFRKCSYLQNMLYTDELTGLFNYRYLKLILPKEIKRAQRTHGKMSVLFIDIDDFKRINDHHGHLFGSALLRELGNFFQKILREPDVIIRYGGDEYVVILTDTDQSQAFKVAERIRCEVQAHSFSIENQDEHVTISIGIANYPEHGLNMERLLAIADENMYRCKKDGKNRVAIDEYRKNIKNDGESLLF